MRRRGISDDRATALLGCGFLLCLPFLFAGCYGCSRVQVSDGYRDGTVRKLSETGVIWKTWELEMLGDGIRFADGKAGPETFQYTVVDQTVREKIQAVAPGKRVRLHYRKTLTAWQPNGETRYLATAVEELP